MTVAELIEALQTLPASLPVYRPTGEGGYERINRVGPVRGEFPDEPAMFVVIDFDPDDLAMPT